MKSPDCSARSNGLRLIVDDLKKHAVLYLNTDGNERGFFGAGGTQDLQPVISAVARDINDPEKNISVFERAHLRAIAHAKDADERGKVRKLTDLRVNALGDGSDYTAFQDFAGIPSLDIGFGGEDEGDQYHSIYDDFYWYTHFADGDFVYGRALAQTAGTAIMRVADSDLLPYDYAAAGRSHLEVRIGSGKAAERQAGRIHRAQSRTPGRRLQRHCRSAQDLRAAARRNRAALHEFRAHEEFS